MATSNQKKVEKLQKQIEKAKVEFATEFTNRWAMRTPVDTGRLLAGNQVTITDTNFTFDNNVPYFTYVENGTPTHRPVGMLRTTVKESPEIWRTAMKRAK
jgi:hypothetical protein